MEEKWDYEEQESVGEGEGSSKVSNNPAIQEPVIKKSSDPIFKKITPKELQYRKTHNLCLKCGEKFGPRHKYKQKGAHMILIEESDSEIEEKEIEEEFIDYQGNPRKRL